MKDEPHGIPGQCNTHVLDKDSEITGYGKHCRLLVFCGDRGIYVREDIRDGLPLSTESDRRKVMNGYQRMHPNGVRLVHVSSVRWTNHGFGESIDHEYVYARGGRRS